MAEQSAKQGSQKHSGAGDEIAVLDFREQVIRTTVQITTQKTVMPDEQLAGQTTNVVKLFNIRV